MCTTFLSSTYQEDVCGISSLAVVSKGDAGKCSQADGHIKRKTHARLMQSLAIPPMSYGLRMQIVGPYDAEGHHRQRQ
jgi:hypothetical protein